MQVKMDELVIIVSVQNRRSEVIDPKLHGIYVIWRDPKKGGGLFSFFSSALGHLKISEEMKRYPVIDWETHHTNLGKNQMVLGTSNVWNYFFEPVSGYKLSDLTNLDNVIYSDGLHPDNIGFPYANLDWIQPCFQKFIRFRKETYDFIESSSRSLELGSETLAVHFRAGVDMRTTPNHPIPPTRKQIVKSIDLALETNDYSTIFLACDVDNEVDYLKKRYGVRLQYLNANRTIRNGDDWHLLEGPQKYQRGLEVLADSYLLSRCGGLIAGYSGVSQFAEIMRDSKNSYYTNLIWNGRLSGCDLFAKYQFRITSTLPNHLGGFKTTNFNADS
jgi:hypothetical protein